MSDPFHIPAKGSPVDIARDIMSHDDVRDAIRDLIAVVHITARTQGVEYADASKALDGNVGRMSLEESIMDEIEERFTEVLQRTQESDRHD